MKALQAVLLLIAGALIVSVFEDLRLNPWMAAVGVIVIVAGVLVIEHLATGRSEPAKKQGGRRQTLAEEQEAEAREQLIVTASQAHRVGKALKDTLHGALPHEVWRERRSEVIAWGVETYETLKEIDSWEAARFGEVDEDSIDEQGHVTTGNIDSGTLVAFVKDKLECLELLTL